MRTKRLTLFLIWLMMTVAYLDRVNITVAGPEITLALHLTKAQFGEVLASFSAGYALMQVPGGWLADRIGARWLLVGALVAWSGFTALTGAARSLGAMLGIRAGFGFGEGVENGAQFKLVADNFAPRERSEASALFLTALAAGPALAAPTASWLIARQGWRWSFVDFAALGLVAAGVLARLLPAQPGPGPGPGAASRDEALYGAGARDAAGWRAALRRPGGWLAFATYMGFNVAFWGFIGWLPTYLADARHIQLKSLGAVASIPYLGGLAGLIALGRLGSGRWLHRRALLVAASHVAAGIGLYATFVAADAARSVAGLTAAAFFLYGGFGPFWALALDMIPAGERGALSGFVNLGGQIGSIAAPLAVGRIVDATHSYAGGFAFMAAGLAVAAGCLVALHGAGEGARGGGELASDAPA